MTWQQVWSETPKRDAQLIGPDMGLYGLMCVCVCVRVPQHPQTPSRTAGNWHSKDTRRMTST
eukprot:243382-Amphidinium_carterae.1